MPVVNVFIQLAHFCEIKDFSGLELVFFLKQTTLGPSGIFKDCGSPAHCLSFEENA